MRCPSPHADRHSRSRSPGARRRTAEQMAHEYEVPGLMAVLTAGIDVTAGIGVLAGRLLGLETADQRTQRRIAAYAAAVEKVCVAARLAITTTRPSVEHDAPDLPLLSAHSVRVC
jgi:hypothetical protein